MAMDFIKLCSQMFALVLSRRIALLLINAYKYKLACACVFPLNHVHDKKLRHNPVKSYIKYADIHWKRLFKSCIIASINHKTKWTAAHVFKQIFFDVLS